VNSDGILLEQAGPALVADNNISLQEDGIRVTGSAEAKVLDNTLRDNWHAGAYLRHGDGNTVAGNDITGGGWGVFVRDNEQNVIRENRIRDSDSYSIVLQSAHRNQVSNNTASQAARGLIVFGDDNRILNNTVRGMGGGIDTVGEGNQFLYNQIEESRDGIDVRNSVDSTVQRNNLDVSRAGLRADNSEHIDARWNWWGDSAGPAGGAEDICTGTVADGDGARINLSDGSSVCFDPWLTEPVEGAGSE